MPDWITTAAIIWIALAGITALVLLRTAAPYGRHVRTGWGPTIPHRPAWVVMELVSPIALCISFYLAGGHLQSTSGLAMALWLLHYANRALVYPLRADWSRRRMPAVIASSAVFFNSVNGLLNGLALAYVPPAWGGAMVVGAALFLGGAILNIDSDGRLLRLRKSGDGGYRIPHGGWFRWVSCPNYLGEIIEWAGFAVLTGNIAALSFAVWTAANLAPRALTHHKWYLKTFPDYPAERTALVPRLL
jgi:3-oxo-5-alpha-steroid 4-dehydrogenase 1